MDVLLNSNLIGSLRALSCVRLAYQLPHQYVLLNIYIYISYVYLCTCSAVVSLLLSVVGWLCFAIILTFVMYYIALYRMVIVIVIYCTIRYIP